MTPGRGFRWVRVGERLKKGDQWRGYKSWNTVTEYDASNWGHPRLKCFYRRRTATRKTKGRA